MIALRESKGKHFFQLDASRMACAAGEIKSEYRVYVEEPKDGNNGKAVKFPVKGELSLNGCHSVIKPSENGNLISIYERTKSVNCTSSITDILEGSMMKSKAADAVMVVVPLLGKVDGAQVDTLILSGHTIEDAGKHLIKYGFVQL